MSAYIRSLKLNNSYNAEKRDSTMQKSAVYFSDLDTLNIYMCTHIYIDWVKRKVMFFFFLCHLETNYRATALISKLER